MADSTPTATPSKDIESCFFQRTISLYDWWLTKAKNDFQGKRLAVAGVSSRKDEAMRVFVSATVIKRYDVFSLKTADGKYVIISGFINEQRTLENGFGPEVFNSFLFGFPPNWESYALDCFREESTTGADLGSAVPESVSASCPEILSDGVEKSIPTSLVSPDDASGDREKSFTENECNVSKEMDGVNVACSSDGKRCSEENSTSVTLENCDVEGLKSSATSVQSQSWRQLSTPSEQLVKKSASRISRTLLPKTEGCYKKKRVVVERKVGRPKKKLTKSAPSVKNPREKDLRHLIKESQQKISTVSVSPESFSKSRSGRLLLPPLEFWRNQIPIYNAAHEITEIQDGATLMSPCRGSSPSLSRFNIEKRAA